MATKKTVATKKTAEPVAKKVVKADAVDVKSVEEKVEKIDNEEVKTEKAPTKAKTARASKAVETEVIIQYRNMEKSINDAASVAKAEFIKQGNKDADIKSVKVYVKPEELAAYCVINDTFEWKVCL